MSGQKQSKRIQIRQLVKRFLKKLPYIRSFIHDSHVHVQQETSSPTESSTFTAKTDESRSQATNPSSKEENKEQVAENTKTTENIKTTKTNSSVDTETFLSKKELIIDPEPTPNPNCYKFTLNTNIGRSFSCSPEENPTHHIGGPLLEIDGIVSIFGVNNFLVLNKDPDKNWDELLDIIVQKIDETLS